MATPYTDIYIRFRNKIRDYEDLALTDSEIEETDHQRFVSARVRFKKCSKLKSKDDVLMQFEDDLDDEEIEIFAILMVVEWLNPRIATLENFKIHMSNRDLNMGSTANHLKTLIDLKEHYKKEARDLMKSYSYNNLINY